MTTQSISVPRHTPGQLFPDFQLPDHNGKPLRLSDCMDGWPTAVVFVRGHY